MSSRHHACLPPANRNKHRSFPIASIRGKLSAKAKLERIDPGRYLTTYFHEGLLARVSSSAYRDQLILKGGLSLYGRYGMLARPTVDVDLSALSISHQPDVIQAVMREIVSIKLPDHLEFDTQGIEVRGILEDAVYPGVRLKIPAQLGTQLGAAKYVLQVDVSFGARITPAPALLSFPRLLEPEGIPILGYPLETLIAEKFAAACELGTGNTRLKDFYDLAMIARREHLNAVRLRTAIQSTFAARNTALETAAQVLSDEFGQNTAIQRQWQQFLNRTRLIAPTDFAEVLHEIRRFLEPILSTNTQGIWQPDQAHWQE